MENFLGQHAWFGEAAFSGAATGLNPAEKSQCPYRTAWNVGLDWCSNLLMAQLSRAFVGRG